MPTSPAGSRQRGYTLAELLVVLALIALIAALAIPAIERGGRITLEAAAEEIGAGLRAARAQALSTNRETVVVFDVAEGRVTGPGERPVAELPSGIEMRLVTAHTEILDGGSAGIRFWPTGGSSGGLIELSRDPAQAQIQVDWFNGRVRIADVHK